MNGNGGAVRYHRAGTGKKIKATRFPLWPFHLSGKNEKTMGTPESVCPWFCWFDVWSFCYANEPVPRADGLK
ncbi:MAG: hypothetical protein A2X84_01980 [Desulfuromonadaceae bacterium GWC2_58_13]|nr:MAG: hypothetical protein A2X84_01980 [Desulfuromonadaceae bacterium GWC2_58_13]